MAKKATSPAAAVDVLAGLVPGLRVKGGVAPATPGKGFVPVIHAWDDVECKGAPREWRAHATFSTGDQAMTYYKAVLRPALVDLMDRLARGSKGINVTRKQLE